MLSTVGRSKNEFYGKMALGAQVYPLCFGEIMIGAFS